MTGRNKVCHQCLHRQFKLVTLYAIVTFVKALLCPWVPSLQHAVFPPTPVPSFLFSFHPSFPSLSALSPRLPLPSCAVKAQQPGLDVWTCSRKEHYGRAALNTGSEPLCPALEASIAIVIGHMGYGVCISLSFGWSFGLASAHTESDYGLLGLDSISIKSLYILQQIRAPSLLLWSSHYRSYLLPACAFDYPSVLARRCMGI